MFEFREIESRAKVRIKLAFSQQKEPVDLVFLSYIHNPSILLIPQSFSIVFCSIISNKKVETEEAGAQTVGRISPPVAVRLSSGAAIAPPISSQFVVLVAQFGHNLSLSCSGCAIWSQFVQNLVTVCH